MKHAPPGDDSTHPATGRQTGVGASGQASGDPAAGSTSDPGARQVLGTARAAAAEAEREYARATTCRLREDYTGALQAYRIAANLGHAMAQNDLGSMLLNGLGSAADPAAAVPWYRKAAEQGLADAQFNLALRLLSGDGGERDAEGAARWLAQAAQQGDIDAMSRLGNLFREGNGVPKDLSAAADLHVVAATAGDPQALDQLAEYRETLEHLALGGDVHAALALCRMHEEGLAVDPDPVQAFAWLRWAQERAEEEPDPADLHDELAEREAALMPILNETARHDGLDRLMVLRARAVEGNRGELTS